MEQKKEINSISQKFLKESKYLKYIFRDKMSTLKKYFWEKIQNACS